jgi:hypothetical protein
MLHPLTCRCGVVRGAVDAAAPHNRVVCYCADCRIFEHFLGRAAEVVDERGGVDIVQILPSALTLEQGADRLACVRMTPRGPLRWYAECCNTPIGSTALSHRTPVVGLVCTCLAPTPILDESFGPVTMAVFTAGAKGEPKPRQASIPLLVLRLAMRGAHAVLRGDHRRTPFFDVATDTPVSPPRVLSAEERARLLAAAEAA